MKKYLFLACSVTLLCSASARAQYRQGQFLTGAQGIFRSIGPTSHSPRIQSGRLSLTGGYFIADNLALGLNARLDIKQWEYRSAGVGIPQVTRFRNTVTGLGPMVRYYVPLGKKTSLIAQGTLEYARLQFSRTAEESGRELSKDQFGRSELQLTYALGIAYAPTNRLSLELLLLQYGILYRLDSGHLPFRQRLQTQPQQLIRPTLGISYRFGDTKKVKLPLE